MKMHRVSAMALAAGLALTLAACGGGNTPAPANTAGGGTTAGGGEKAKIVVDMWAGSEDDTAALNAQLDVVKRDNPDIEVELRTAPWGDFFTKLTTNMASNNMACVTGMILSLVFYVFDKLKLTNDQ